MTQTSQFDGLAVVADAKALGISRETSDFLALVAIFRTALRGQLDIEASALVQLARELEPYRLTRVPTPRLTLLTSGAVETRN